MIEHGENEAFLPEESETDPRSLAEHRFVESLLVRMFRGQDARHLETQIDEALSKIDRDSPLGHVHHRSRSPVPLWILPAAAAIVVVSLTIWLAKTPPSVNDAFARVLASANSEQDREYQVETRLSGGARLKSSLYLRGQERFAARFTWNDNEGWFGNSGEEAWAVPAMPGLPVYITEDLEYLSQILERFNLAQMPWLTMSSALTNMWNHYEVSMEDDVETHLIRLRGVLRDTTQPLPAVIGFRARRSDGTLTNMAITWTETDAKVPVREIVLELVSENPLAEDWYEHESHHAAERHVIRWNPPAGK